MADITRHGILMTQAIQEAAAAAPVGRVMLAAYELNHSSLAAPIRFVNDRAALTATLEVTAPVNPGTTVEFLACPLERVVPEENDSAASPTVSLSRPDVSGILKVALDAARGSTDSWTLIERIYVSDDTTEPAFRPVRIYEITSFNLAGDMAQLSARYGDWVNISIPRTTFKRSTYPGLQR